MFWELKLKFSIGHRTNILLKLCISFLSFENTFWLLLKSTPLEDTIFPNNSKERICRRSITHLLWQVLSKPNSRRAGRWIWNAEQSQAPLIHFPSSRCWLWGCRRVSRKMLAAWVRWRKEHKGPNPRPPASSSKDLVLLDTIFYFDIISLIWALDPSIPRVYKDFNVERDCVHGLHWENYSPAPNCLHPTACFLQLSSSLRLCLSLLHWDVKKLGLIFRNV